MLLKTVHVVDPAAGRNGRFDILIEDGRVARVGTRPAGRRRARRRAAAVVRRDAGAHRHPRAPARAGTGTQGDDRHRHGVGGRRRVHRRRVHAEHRSRSTTTPSVTEFIVKRAAEAGLARVYPIGAVSIGSKGEQLTEIGDLQRGRLRRDHRRRPAGGDGAADAARARVRVDVRDAGHRSLRGPVAQGRRRRARRARSPRCWACKRHSGRGRVGDGRARHLDRGADRRARAHRAHERAAVAARRARRQGARHQVTCEVTPHHFVLTDEALRRARRLRHEHQDESAAARGGRSRRDDRRPARRLDRRHRHRSRAASRRREGARVRPRAVRHRRTRDCRAAVPRSARARRRDRAAAAGRAAVGESGARARSCPAARSPKARRPISRCWRRTSAVTIRARVASSRNRRTRRSTAGR